MNKIILIILGVLLNVSSVYAQNIYLLTSLKVDKKPLLARRSWSYSQKLENIFLKKTSDFQYNVIVKHGVTPHQLRIILEDEETYGVFWLSHGRDGVVKDQYGNNIKTMFLNLNKNMRFLGLVSCQGQFIIDELNKYGLQEKYPNLKTYGDLGKVNGAKFLKKSIKVFRYLENFQSETIATNEEQLGSYFSIKRELTVDSEEMFIMLDDQFIVGTFPKGLAGEIQEHEVFIKQGILNKVNSFDFIFRRSFKKMSKKEFGILDIDSNDYPGLWELFAFSNGEPLGRNALYEFIKE